MSAMATYVANRPGLDRRLLSVGAFSYTAQTRMHSLSQPTTVMEDNVAKRMPARAPPAKMAKARRKLVSSAVQDYLKDLNPMARSIVLEKETLEHDHKEDWDVMNEEKKEQMLNDHFIPLGVRAHYEPGFTGTWPRRPRRAASSDMLLSPHGDEWEYHTNDDLVLKNRSATMPWKDSGSLSQPPSYDPETTFTSHYRLHKKQLSFRPNHSVRAGPQTHSYPQRKPRDSLGSDGESPRTSDEDSTHYNPLGFHRNRLRSYSMRPKRGNIRNNTALRASARAGHRVQRPMTPDASAHHEVYPKDNSRPSHYRDEAQYNPDADFDAEIDLPDESLLLDHVHRPADESADELDTVSSKPPRYSRARRSLRTKPKVLVESTDTDSESVVISNTYAEMSKQELSASTTTLDEPSLSAAELPLPRTSSRDSLDCISFAPSNISATHSLISKLMQEDDDSRAMTPDSVISVGSNSSYRPRSKQAELAVMRNPRGKRGGSSYKKTTSEFADRHSQFKANMLKKQKQTSREPTPAASTPTPDDSLSQDFLKPPPLTISFSKHGSLVESETTDLPSSPDLCSPPATPLTLSSLLIGNRESGYISSSSESFAIRR